MHKHWRSYNWITFICWRYAIWSFSYFAVVQELFISFWTLVDIIYLVNSVPVRPNNYISTSFSVLPHRLKCDIRETNLTCKITSMNGISYVKSALSPISRAGGVTAHFHNSLLSDLFNNGGWNVILVVNFQGLQEFQVSKHLLWWAPEVLHHASRARRIWFSLGFYSFHNTNSFHDQLHSCRGIL